MANKIEQKDIESMPHGFSIAIDGPVASGKGTLATVLAQRLDGFFMNTGAMYRCVALLCIEGGLAFDSEEQVRKVLPGANIALESGRVLLNENDVTERIQGQDVSHGSSVIAVYGRVRENLVKRQQEIARKKTAKGLIVISEGRDTGTKVFPEASLKIFLTANIDTRAKRRLEQYREKGIEKSLEEVREEIRIRDERDTNRKIDPLVSDPEARGYWVLDNSEQTEEESVEAILGELKKRGLVND